MALLVSITGASGFIASFVLLSNGMLTMWVRYLAAFGIAYLVFLGLLWLWLRTSAKDYDGLDPGIPLPNQIGSESEPVFCGKGGGFDGGGASGNFDDAVMPSTSFDDDGTIFKEAASVAAEADEFAIPLFAIFFLGGLVLSSFWVVYAAPLLFAELLVDGVLAVSLYKRLRGLEARHWLETAVRRTAAPFCITAILLVGAGLTMQHYAPNAHTLAQAFSQLRTSR